MLETLHEIFNKIILKNSVADYSIALLTLVVGLILLKILRRVFIKRLRQWAIKTESKIDDTFLALVETFAIPFSYIALVYNSIQDLKFHRTITKSIDVIGLTLVTIITIRAINILTEYGIKNYWLTSETNENHPGTVKVVLPALRVIVWTVGVIFLLDNLKFNLTAVLTSLGIGGAAIALASKGFFEDFFSYIAIALDRPFEIGDFLNIGDYAGTVEHIGIKTTRLQSLSGEQLIFSNTDLTSSRVKNFKRMEQRRVVFQIGVVYETPLAKLQEIPALIEEIINGIEGVTFDRAHFASYGEYSLRFEVVYFVQGNEYLKYMNSQQKINLELLAQFTKRGIEFALPVQKNLLESPSIEVNEIGDVTLHHRVHSSE